MKRILLLLFASLLAFEVYALTAYEIMKKVDARETGDSNKGKSTMILIDKKGNQRKRQLVTYAVQQPEVTRAILFFESPPDMSGTGFLSYNWQEAGKETDQWLYLPALKKVKRIAAGDRSGSFLGSDFTYSDMSGTELDDYTYKLLGEEKVPKKVKPGQEQHDTYRIEATPKTEEIKHEFGYLKSQVWIVKEAWVVIKAKNYLLKKGGTKQMIGKDLRNVNGIWTLFSTKMTTYQGKSAQHATILLVDDVQYNLTIDPSIFTERQLIKGL
ncbi:outer membrane lipoprotein-sorting protein [Deltaproteobacteria bacterium TL4]